MKKTIKMNVVLAMVLSVTLLFGATISANAADVTVSFEVQKTDVGPRTTGDGYYESCVVAIENNQIEFSV